MHAATNSDHLTRLWSAARAAFARMCAAVGEAAALAARSALEARQRRAVAAWLCPIEAFVRMVVLVEAAALARIPEPPRAPRSRRAQAARALKRTVSLRLWPKTKPALARIRLLGAPTSVAEVFRDRTRLALARRLAEARRRRAPAPVRLARRIEALARVIASPWAAARRLARKLRRAPRLALVLAVRRQPRSDRVDNAARDEACRLAYTAVLALNDTG